MIGKKINKALEKETTERRDPIEETKFQNL